MSYTTTCPHCGGRLVLPAFPGDGVYEPPHQCPPRNPNTAPIYYSPMQPQPGCRPLQQLTEEDVRRIVREELKRAKVQETP